jgi:hypothetical protein
VDERVERATNASATASEAITEVGAMEIRCESGPWIFSVTGEYGISDSLQFPESLETSILNSSLVLGFCRKS